MPTSPADIQIQVGTVLQERFDGMCWTYIIMAIDDSDMASFMNVHTEREHPKVSGELDYTPLLGIRVAQLRIALHRTRSTWSILE